MIKGMNKVWECYMGERENTVEEGEKKELKLEEDRRDCATRSASADANGSHPAGTSFKTTHPHEF